jgi:hypothetical protein
MQHLLAGANPPASLSLTSKSGETQSLRMNSHTSVFDLVPQSVIEAPARIPALYQGAVAAIKECDRVDECKTWADKMEALASYARQAHDETLHNYAKRIQGRAVRRSGELLKEIEPSSGRQPEKGEAPLNCAIGRSVP